MTDFPLCRGEMDKQKVLSVKPMDKLKHKPECYYQDRAWFGEDGKQHGTKEQGCMWQRRCFVESFNRKLEDGYESV